MNLTRSKPIGLTALVLLFALCIQVAAMSPVSAASAREEAPAYRFNIDQFSGGESPGGGDCLLVSRDWVFKAGEAVKIAGWLATEAGVESYRYAFVPVGDTGSVGSVEWKTPESLTIAARPDLTKAGIPYETGHGTAGFSLECKTPVGADGIYDFYLRGVTKTGGYCDLLVTLHVTVGDPDADDGETRVVNLTRVAREIQGMAGLSASKSGVTLSAEGVLPLGLINLTAFEQVSITYTLSDNFTAEQDGRTAALGFKQTAAVTAPNAAIPTPYRAEDGLYDLRGSLILGRLSDGRGTHTLTFDLTEVGGYGGLYLSGYLFGQDSVTVTDITFTYRGKTESRTAARILCSGELSPYFSGYNCVTTETVSDPALGDVLRIQASEDTNDPYVYFNAELLLQNYGLRMNADEYCYMVVLARARKGNAKDHMTFYLCAGDINSPTEKCTTSQKLKTDGQWHYYLIDLASTDTWAGIIHGWRFDMINGQTAAGDWVDYASVQLFRTREAAAAVAAGDPLKPDSVFQAGGELVLRDDREEKDSVGTTEPFLPAEKDVYQPPMTETETVTETGTDANPTTDTETETKTDADIETDAETDNETEIDTDTETDIETNTEIDTDTETDTDTPAGTEPATTPDADSETNFGSDSETTLIEIPETAPETDIPPESVPETDPDTAASSDGCGSALAGAGLWLACPAALFLCGGRYRLRRSRESDISDQEDYSE